MSSSTRNRGERVAVGMNLPCGDHSQCDVFEASVVDNLVSERQSSMSIFPANFFEAAKEDQS